MPVEELVELGHIDSGDRFNRHGGENVTVRPDRRPRHSIPTRCEIIGGHPAAITADAIHERYPGKLLAYNCSPSFNWKQHLDDAAIAGFQKELGAMGYRFQFITLAGFHSLNSAMFDLARGYANEGMSAYVRLQQDEFAMAPDGYSAVRHQREVGAGYFDEVSRIISNGTASTLALAGSTEQQQF